MPQTKERRRELYQQNRDTILARNRAYREAHKTEIAVWVKEYHKAYYSSNQESIKAAAKEYKEKTKYSNRHIKMRLLRFAKYRAKRDGLAFNLSLDDIEIPKYCPVLGIELRPAEPECMDGAPTIDRVIPALGYTKGNVQVISHRANTLKRDATIKEIESLLAYMRRVTPEQG